MARWWRSERPLIALVTTFVLLGVVYSVMVPLWEAPDEMAHFACVVHIATTRSLPVQRMGVLDWQSWAWTGAWCGLAVLAKSSAFVVGLTAGVLLWLSAARHRSWRLLWRGALALCGLSLLGWGMWLWRRRWRSLDRARSLHRATRTALVAAGAGLLVLAATVPAWVIRPQYVTPTLAKWQVWNLPYRSAVTFGERMRLLGYRVERAASPDQRNAIITCYWQAVQHPELDYSAFVHVIDEAGQLIAQRDAGLGSDRNYPTSAWWAEDIAAQEMGKMASCPTSPGADAC